jgi:hypothetical protein
MDKIEMSKKVEDKKYYIYSHKRTSGYIRTFWRPNEQGYTIDLNKSGLYDEKFAKENQKNFPIVTSLHELDEHIRKSGRDTFLIPEDKVEEILGVKMTCIAY